MCLYPRLIENPKYRPNKKNGGKPPKAADLRLKMVPIACGNCIECRKQNANNWRIRLTEELKSQNEEGKKGYMVTLTFDNKHLNKYIKLATEENTDKDTEPTNKYEQNEIKEYKTINKAAKIAIRRFLERWRQKYKRSLRHFFITELGEENDRLHLHGIIFTEEEKANELQRIWKNGIIHRGNFCNLQTINYIIKYITKYDNKHKGYKPSVLCSPAIGRNYIKTGKTYNKFKKENTKEYYRTEKGYKLNLPIYYRNAIYSEKEKEQLWLYKLDKQTRYILGTEYKTDNLKNTTEYIKALKEAQNKNIKLGYGKIEYKIEDYTKALKKINKI